MLVKAAASCRGLVKLGCHAVVVVVTTATVIVIVAVVVVVAEVVAVVVVVVVVSAGLSKRGARLRSLWRAPTGNCAEQKRY